MALNLDPTNLSTMLVATPNSTGATPVSTMVNGIPVAATLEVQSTIGAFLLPRMTNAEMLALTPVVDGMIVYNTTNAAVYFRQAASWIPEGSGGGAGTVTSLTPANSNIILTPDPITTTGTIGLNPILSGLTSVDTGNTTYSSLSISTLESNFLINVLGVASAFVVSTSSLIDLQAGSLGSGSVNIREGARLRFFDNSDTTAVSLKSPSSLGVSTTYTLPATLPISNNQVLASTTAGIMSWQSLGTGTVTSITAGSNLNGGVITSSGTISLANTISGLTSVSSTAGVFGGITLSTTTISTGSSLLLNPTNTLTLAGALVVTQADFVIANGHALTLNNSGNAFKTSFVCANTGADQSYRLPLIAPTSNNQVLASTTAGLMSWITAAGSVTSITQGANIVLTPSPITTTGSVALNPVLTGITSAVIGGATYNSSGVSLPGSPYQITGEGIGLSGLGLSNSFILTDCPIRIPANGASTANQGLQLAIGPFALSLYSGNSSANQFYVFPATDPTGTQVLTGVVSSGKVLMSWASVGAGTVTSITAGSNLTGGTITGSGTIALASNLFGLTSAVIGGHTYSSSGVAAISGYTISTSSGIIQLQPASTFTVDVNSDLRITDAGGATSGILFFDLTSKSAKFKAPNALVQNNVYTLPTDYPAVSGYHLASTTAGVMSWSADTGAANTLKFLVQQADGSIPNAQAMGSLATGLVKNTTTTGVQSIAVAGTDYYAPDATYALKLNNVGGTPNANLFLANTSNAPTTPTGGGVFYVQAGALHYIGSNGTVTTIAPA